jgi:hypothetical protein
LKLVRFWTAIRWKIMRIVKREDCFVRVLVSIPPGELFLNQLSNASGLEIVNSKLLLLRPYRRDEGIGHTRAACDLDTLMMAVLQVR